MTRGKSMGPPTSYKGDTLVQAWLDARVLATLCKWLEDNEIEVKYLSHVVKEVLEIVADKLVEEGKASKLSTTMSRTYLEHKFKVNLNRGGRGKKNLLNNILLDGERGEEGNL